MSVAVKRSVNKAVVVAVDATDSIEVAVAVSVNELVNRAVVVAVVVTD